ncbi:MAG: tetratricopeptide repeat protein [Candidatus Rokuibacteriota bacterium]
MRHKPTGIRALQSGWCAALLTALLLLGMPTVGLPDGGGGGGGGSNGGSSTNVKEDSDYSAAVKAIKAGNFSAAIPLLEGVVARDGANADAYNWLAYSIRRSGDPARSIPLYQKALTIDAKHRGAHEYIGEAYLALDNVAKAKEHLARLNALCFFPCSEYRDLKKAVEAYEASGGKVKPTGRW